MKTFNDNASISDFNAWSGGEETQNTIIQENKENDFDAMIEELYPDGIGETALNDLLRFESDWIFETLGIEQEEE